METIGTWWMWLGFFIIVLAMLSVDLFVVGGGRKHRVTFREAGLWSIVWVGVSLAFAGALWFYLDGAMGREILHGRRAGLDQRFLDDKFVVAVASFDIEQAGHADVEGVVVLDEVLAAERVPHRRLGQRGFPGARGLAGHHRNHQGFQPLRVAGERGVDLLVVGAAVQVAAVPAAERGADGVVRLHDLHQFSGQGAGVGLLAQRHARVAGGEAGEEVVVGPRHACREDV